MPRHLEVGLDVYLASALQSIISCHTSAEGFQQSLGSPCIAQTSLSTAPGSYPFSLIAHACTAVHVSVAGRRQHPILHVALTGV